MDVKAKILFSCVGTSDPVRGLHDGGMLHIMRHYRPSVVCLFLTPEIAAHDKLDHRFQKAIDFAKSNWDGYEVEYLSFYSDVQDASDLDALDRPLYDAVNQIYTQYPDAELLFNLSSGTPQMQIILSQMALDIRYRAKGIQVKNFEKKAGTSQRTNDQDYDIDLELELNEDEDPASPNRCIEPQMIYLQRSMQREQLKALLDQHDYMAIRSMKGSLSAPLMTLVSHLVARSQLQHKEALRLAKQLNLPFPLYPVKKILGKDTKDYQEVSEYFLILKNMQDSQRYTDFVVRLNPFVVRLQSATLVRYLGFPLTDILDSGQYPRRRILSVSRLEKKLPELRAYLDRTLKRRGFDSVKDRDLSIFLCNRMLEYFSDVPQPVMELFGICEELNAKRNSAAHDLTSITDNTIQSQCGLTSSQLVKRIEEALPLIYPECNPALFTVYQDCEAYIRQKMPE